MQRRFYVQTIIFQTDITAKAKLVYIYLCSMADRKAASFPSRKTIGEACSLSVASVKRSTNELAAHGLIQKDTRFVPNGRQTSNRYSIVKWEGAPIFYCDNSIFDIDMPANIKLTYFFIKRCTRNGAAFPSYRNIAVACGISLSTAVEYIKLLTQLGYILKENQYRTNGGRSNNLYTEAEQPEQIYTVIPTSIYASEIRVPAPPFLHRPPPYTSRDPP